MNRPFFKRSIPLAGVLLLLLFGTTACTTVLQYGKPTKEKLSSRVERLWQAKVEEDRKAVYRMTDAKFRESVTLDNFVSRRKYSILSYRIKDIRMAEDNQSAHVIVIFEGILFGQKRKVSVGERWIWESGQWRLKLSDPVNPFRKKS